MIRYLKENSAMTYIMSKNYKREAIVSDVEKNQFKPYGDFFVNANYFKKLEPGIPKDLLQDFDIFLNKYKDNKDVKEFVAGSSWNADNIKQLMIDVKSNIEIKKATRKDVKVIYDDANWNISSPLTYEASEYLSYLKGGNQATWCTARRSDVGKGHYNHYTSKAPLFVITNKKATGEKDQKWQVYAVPNSNEGEFKNSDDIEINVIHWRIKFNPPQKMLDALDKALEKGNG